MTKLDRRPPMPIIIKAPKVFRPEQLTTMVPLTIPRRLRQRTLTLPSTKFLRA